MVCGGLVQERLKFRGHGELTWRPPLKEARAGSVAPARGAAGPFPGGGAFVVARAATVATIAGPGTRAGAVSPWIAELGTVPRAPAAAEPGTEEFVGARPARPPLEPVPAFGRPRVERLGEQDHPPIQLVIHETQLVQPLKLVNRHAKPGQRAGQQEGQPDLQTPANGFREHAAQASMQ